MPGCREEGGRGEDGEGLAGACGRGLERTSSRSSRKALDMAPDERLVHFSRRFDRCHQSILRRPSRHALASIPRTILHRRRPSRRLPPMSPLPDFLRPLVLSGPSGTGKSTLLSRLFSSNILNMSIPGVRCSGFPAGNTAQFHAQV